MKINLNISKKLAFGLLAFTVAGCNEDFLDTKPIGQPSELTWYSDFTNTDMTCTAAYSILCTDDARVMDIFYIVGLGNTPCEDYECGGENTKDYGTSFQRVDQMTHDANPSEFGMFYGYMYKGIRYANTALTYLPKLQNLSDGEVKLAKQRTAEMKYLRALYHFQLAQVFGGVPIIETGNMDPTLFGNVKRNSLKEVYDFIIQNFKEAIPDLPTRSQLEAQGQQGRASKGAAQAYLAKALVYESSYAENYAGDKRFEGMQNRYAEALQYAKDIINSGEYELVGLNGGTFTSWHGGDGSSTGVGAERVMNTGPVGAFRWLFSTDGDNSKEGVFEIQNVNDQLGWMNTRGQRLTVYTTVRYTEENGAPSSSQFGWSFNPPTQYLVDAFGNEDDRENGLSSAAVEPRLDPRFKVTIGEKGDSCVRDVMVGGKKGTGKVGMAFTNLPTGMMGRKWECSPAEFWMNKSSDGGAPMNLRLMRISDVYLLAAEAAWKSGDKALATEYVNLVRQRARNSGTTGYPQAITGTCSFEDIIHERRIELAGEGHRFFDLVRWKLASKFITGTVLKAYNDQTVDFVEGKNEFFPFYRGDMQMSENSGFQQNPGY